MKSHRLVALATVYNQMSLDVVALGAMALEAMAMSQRMLLEVVAFSELPHVTAFISSGCRRIRRG